jgi:hypothetical protein
VQRAEATLQGQQKIKETARKVKQFLEVKSKDATHNELRRYWMYMIWPDDHISTQTATHSASRPVASM